MKGNTWTAAGLLAAALVALVVVVPEFRAMHVDEAIRKGPGVTSIRPLSDWHPPLRGTPGDTDVYVLDSGRRGGTVLVLGGTHPNEPSGVLTAVVLIENARPAAGRLIVIPRANESGFTHTDYSEGAPQHFAIPTASGERIFRFGSRATNPIHQWPDPDIYVHSSGQRLSGSETRNLNRAYPGRADGPLTEQVAYAIVQLIRAEKADLSIDLHEASPEYPVINAMVAHERAMDLAAAAAIGLQMDGVEIGLEPSPRTLRGLSHREWGDATDTLAVLAESANPAQGRLRGATSSALVVTGADRMYAQAAHLGRLFVPFEGQGIPLSVRVARHTATVMELVRTWSEASPGRAVEIEGVPAYGELVGKGVGAYLG
jgi:hypothetical protein